ncbi:MAG: damage-inducible protein DinB [Acidimicrobiia bacterium]|nr:damage-inducible protein DinB [Acidimicrobiia bacterium]
MALVDALLPEFDHEMATTRTVLERVPEDKLAWKPHPTSSSLGDLATHVATIPMWGEMTLNRDELDLGGAGRVAAAASRAALLEQFGRNAAGTRAALVGRSDAELMAHWSLKNGDQMLFTLPKAMVWRSFVMNHLIHHRAQLAVYLRMLEVPVPSMYGPSRDENPF